MPTTIEFIAKTSKELEDEFLSSLILDELFEEKEEKINDKFCYALRWKSEKDFFNSLKEVLEITTSLKKEGLDSFAFSINNKQLRDVGIKIYRMKLKGEEMIVEYTNLYTKEKEIFEEPFLNAEGFTNRFFLCCPKEIPSERLM